MHSWPPSEEKQTQIFKKQDALEIPKGKGAYLQVKEIYMKTLPVAVRYWYQTCKSILRSCFKSKREHTNHRCSCNIF